MTLPAKPYKNFPKLSALVDQIDAYLARKYPDFFGKDPSHPYLPLRRAKVVHDNIWGTNRFTWRELVLIDSPIIQRLRDIHQVGLGFHVYPSARHTRFEHCLGVATIASRVFDALLQKNKGEFENILKVIEPSADAEDAIRRLRQELRLAALLHDTGHSLYSHTSELVYSKLQYLKEAQKEVKKFTGKERGVGEIISFCIASTPAVARLLQKAKSRLIGDSSSDDYSGEVNLANVALMIVGRTNHPYTQFLADIVSSGFDADKLDYLLRDARAAGLPLSYDIDRYLYAVRVEKDKMEDDESELENFYKLASAIRPERKRPDGPGGASRYPYYDTYRLRLPRKAINAIEQIIICKMMLFGYLYHHPKVRAAEGVLQLLLEQLVSFWKKNGSSEQAILEKFLDFTDSILCSSEIGGSPVKQIAGYGYRITNRLLPREVYRFGGGATSHAEGALLADFLTNLQDFTQRTQLVADLEKQIGVELLKLDSGLGSDSSEALLNAGVWLDIPKQPRFEDINVLVSSETTADSVQIAEIFPISQWTQAYTAFRYYVRIFAFSEYCNVTETAAKSALQKVIKIKGDQFYKEAKRARA
jgi:HD superfamily phosphohydrolase